MKRAWRVVRLAVLALVGGAVVSVLVAEGIGVSGAVRWDYHAGWRMVAVQTAFANVAECGGRGWSQLWWDVMSSDRARIIELIAGLTRSGPDRGPLHSDLDPASVRPLPGWSVLRDPRRMSDAVQSSGDSHRDATREVGIGWPFISFSMDWSVAPSPVYHGASVVSESANGALRVLLWRPIPLGLAADALFYAVGAAGLAGGGRLFVLGRRRRRGACAACGYDRRGLVAGSACPECGRGP